MKHALLTGLIIALIGQSLSNLTVVGGFLLNQEQIAEAFCINKKKPQLNCNGKCYLAQKLKAIEQQGPSPQQAPVQVRVLPLVQPPARLVVIIQPTANAYAFLADDCLCYEAPVFSIFHPPWFS